jgi:hypothetical protein
MCVSRVTCHIVAMGKACPLLLEHHSNDGAAAVSHFPIATEGYRPLIQMCIIIVLS